MSLANFRSEKSKMFIVSVAALYAELVLIRWIGTEVRLFAFVQNLALVTCFLGFGIGCLQSGNKSQPLTNSLFYICMINILISITYLPIPGAKWAAANWFSEFLALSSDSALWSFAADLPKLTVAALSVLCLVAMTAFLWLIAATMMPFGRLIGECFDASPNPLRAYTVNLLGSLLGTWLLLGLSVIGASPNWWLLVLFLLVLFGIQTSRAEKWLGIVLFLTSISASGMIGRDLSTMDAKTIWSPYQKLQFLPQSDGEYSVRVNNTAYMSMANTTPAHLEKHPDFAAKYRDSVYDSPFRFVPDNAEILIVGAGAGNDASAALRNGAASVDAVEIDPVIYEMGKKLHPDQPYSSPKVRLVVNDARNFFRISEKRYDAIIFGLLDSHTGFSGYSNMRVDNYVYTKEAFEQARSLLKSDGVMIVKFEVREPWLWMGERLSRTLSEVFSRTPLVYRVSPVGGLWSGTIFLESASDSFWQKAEEPANKEFLESHPPHFSVSSSGPEPASDDWPYMYNRDRSIPMTYMMVSLVLLVLSLFMVRKYSVFSAKSISPFLLGAGFLLMETQLVSRLGLYFGSTWIVNSIAISTILIFLMLANVFLEMHKKPLNTGAYTLCLAASLLANYAFPWEELPYSSTTTGLLLSGAYAVSVFLGGVVFTDAFRKTENKSRFLGANVLGSVAGGILQNLSFLFGLKALLLLACACYIGAAFTNLRKAKAT